MKRIIVALLFVSICCGYASVVSAEDVAKSTTTATASANSSDKTDNLSVPTWKVARRIVLDCYKSSWSDVDVKVSGGYETRYSADGEPISGPVGTAVLTVPLLSKNEKLNKQISTDGRLEHLADLYAEIEIQLATIDIVSELAATMKSTMMDSGQTGIIEYFEVVKQIATAESKKNLAERKIKSILDNCGWDGKGD